MKASSDIDLAIIIPAYGESQRIGKTLEELAKYLSTQDFGRVSVVVVAAHKPEKKADKTVAVVSGYTGSFRHLSVIDVGAHPGGLKGQDVKLGMLKVAGKYKIFMDADLATPLHHLAKMVELLKGGADVVIGERDLSKIHKGLLRRFISMGGNLLVRTLLRIHYTDTQCGFKGFRSEVAKDLFSAQTIMGWGFDMEILAVARKRRYQVAKIKVTDWRDVAGGNLEGATAQAALSSLKDILYIRWNLWHRRYARS